MLFHIATRLTSFFLPVFTKLLAAILTLFSCLTPIFFKLFTPFLTLFPCLTPIFFKLLAAILTLFSCLTTIFFKLFAPFLTLFFQGFAPLTEFLPSLFAELLSFPFFLLPFFAHFIADFSLTGPCGLTLFAHLLLIFLAAVDGLFAAFLELLSAFLPLFTEGFVHALAAAAKRFADLVSAFTVRRGRADGASAFGRGLLGQGGMGGKSR
ncbi:MAG: hypothetical protein COV67_07625 [Nitrospinae bacterium CG11_big_fil_rev_8_21_14_0_20_56_8]|nr:MAG: hypothetical protein COV67_07625 [Nitrospinae bacterium CG11_big_fil_rev_8_21_14_0_20_56_8]